MRGQVLWGSNSIFSVQENAIGSAGAVYECRFKGKKLKVANEEYNPLAPGDFVEIQPEGGSSKHATILGRLERARWLERWNKKRNAPQIIASNIDLLVIVGCVTSPPFRPRFVDRCLVAATSRDIPILIVINKVDLGVDDQDGERIMHYQHMHYDVMLCSVEIGEGIAELRSRMAGKLVAFVGQSGVGKSSLLTALDPEILARVGDVSTKFNRGTHTTTLARTYITSCAQGIIDTPGIRELDLSDCSPEIVAAAFPDLAEFAPGCEFSPCTHRDEPGCAVLAALAAGRIPPDRYDSYRRIIDSEAE